MIGENRRSKTWQYLIAFVAFAYLIYWPSLLGDPFWDDWVYIFRSFRKQMEGPSPLIFWPGGDSPKSWPLFFTVLWGMLKVFGTKYYLYHVVNITLHGLNGFMIWKLMRKYRVQNSFLITLLFLGHPLHLFTVSWIMQLKTVLSIFFCLIAVTSLIRFYEEEKKRDYFISVVFFILSLLTKSTTVALGAAVLFLYPEIKKKLGMRKVMMYFIIPFILLCLVATVRTAWTFNIKEALNADRIELANRGLINSKESEYDISTSQKHLKPGEVIFQDVNYVDRTLLTAKLFARYLGFIILPLESSYIFQEKTELSYFSTEFILIFLTVSGVYYLISYLHRNKMTVELTGLIFFLASLVPFCGIVYIPIFGVSNFVPYWLSVPFIGILPLIARFIRLKKVLIPLVVAYSFSTHWSSHEFINVEEIFINSIKKSPQQSLYTISLIEHYVFTGQCKKASEAYEKFEENESTKIFCLDIKVTGCKEAK